MRRTLHHTVGGTWRSRRVPRLVRVCGICTPAIRLTLCAARAAHNPFSRFSRFATSFIHNYRWCVCVSSLVRRAFCAWTARERPHTYLYIYNNNTSKKTFSGGCLGSRNDEERSEMRYGMRIAESSESSRLCTHIALSGYSWEHACLSACKLHSTEEAVLDIYSPSNTEGVCVFRGRVNAGAHNAPALAG